MSNVRVLVRLFILTLLLFLSPTSNASGDPEIVTYYEKDYAISITTDGTCGSSICIEVVKYPLTEKSILSRNISFEKECYLTKHGKKIKSDDYLSGAANFDGFVCHPKGSTPLAGATYRYIQFGRSHHDDSCGMEKGPVYTTPGNKYICVKGCSNPQVPELLLGSDGSC